MFAKRLIPLLSFATGVALLTSSVATVNGQDPDGSDSGCGPYISGGPDNPTAGELVATAVVDGILLGPYAMDGGDHFVRVRCDTYHQIGDPIPIEN